ncbi:hypothetical protein UlMin_006626 [Ulmus minor]
MQYLKAIRSLMLKNFEPIRTIHVSYVPEEEIGGAAEAALFTASNEFKNLNVGVFHAKRVPWLLIIKAKGKPGHGSSLYDNSAMEIISQFDMVKASQVAFSQVISVNSVYLKSGIASPTGFMMNMQPSEAEAGFNVRLPPTADPDLVRRRIEEEWAPAARNMSFQMNQLGPIGDNYGRPLITVANDSNPWWSVFKEAVTIVGGTLNEQEILQSTTDARYVRRSGIPVLAFSPMANTPILLHVHNEFLKDTVYLKGIEVYESVIRSLSNFQQESINTGNLYDQH